MDVNCTDPFIIKLQVYTPSSFESIGSNWITVATALILILDEELTILTVELIMVTLLSAVMMSLLNQTNSIMSRSTSGSTNTEQITCCLCPRVLWPKPLGCR